MMTLVVLEVVLEKVVLVLLVMLALIHQLKVTTELMVILQVIMVEAAVVHRKMPVRTSAAMENPLALLVLP